MRFLIDNSADKVATMRERWPDLVAGQLLTPLTKYALGDGSYAVDNGAFTRFDRAAWTALLSRNTRNRERCLWVAVPDVVGSARRTLEVFARAANFRELGIGDDPWPLALVAQDGIEDLEIPWSKMAAIFVGGTDKFKNSDAAIACIKAAKILGLQAHVGRINTPERFARFCAAGADTCDGTGVSRYDHMIQAIADRDRQMELAQARACCGVTE